ncbi:MAG: CotH kinase family protein [Bacteroidales bacterium]|nr:CotH kinase family protein [Bacteroidales bacterium]
MKHCLKIISLILLAGLFGACQVKEEIPGDNVPKMFPALTEFHFSGGDLGDEIAECNQVSTDLITLDLRGLEEGVELVPSAEGRFKLLKINDQAVSSGTKIALYRENTVTLFGYNASQKREYRLIVSFNEYVPKITITTKAPIADKFNYVDASFVFSDFPGKETIETTGGIHGRGNSTWLVYPKKPYRIKLSEAEKIFGMKKDKDWVLLAEYCDKSLMRNAYINTISKTVGLPWNPGTIHVSLYLNGQYEGLYLLTEAVEDGKNKVDIEPDGFIIENDNYWNQEPLYVRTDMQGRCYTFKYPDADDKEIVSGDDNFNYIKKFLDEMEYAIYYGDMANEAKGYRKYVDVDSWAKWFITQEIMGNLDTNPFLALKTRGAKLEFYPVWDAEWSMGLASPGDNGWQVYPETPRYTVETEVWSHAFYFERLFQDPYFVKYVYDTWQTFKAKLPEVRQAVAAEADYIKEAQVENFARWDVLGKPISVGLYFFDTWEEEVAYIADWFDRRVDWFGTFITNRYYQSR